MVKISKQISALLTAIAIPAAISVAKEVGKKTVDNMVEKNKEKTKQEKLYNDEKHSQKIKAIAIGLLMMSSLFTAIAIKNQEIIVGIIGILAIIFIGYAYLLCLEILNEQRKHLHQVMLAIGSMLLIIVIALLYL